MLRKQHNASGDTVAVASAAGACQESKAGLGDAEAAADSAMHAAVANTLMHEQGANTQKVRLQHGYMQQHGITALHAIAPASASAVAVL
jgi:hypothetical protein